MKLIPLHEIPYRGRSAERAERAKHPTREAALAAATYEMLAAPGTYSGPACAPPTLGCVLSREAASALAEVMVAMPGGTSHRHYDVQCRVCDGTGVVPVYNCDCCFDACPSCDGGRRGV